MKLVPVLCGASFKNKGVQPLLDAVVDYLPSPLDIPPMQGINPETGEPESARPSDDEPFAALAFKIMNDPFVGQLTFLRVYSGTLEAGSGVFNSTQGQEGAHRPPAPDAREQARGDRGRRARATSLPPSASSSRRTGDTLCDADQADRARVDDVPGAGDRGRDRAEDEGRRGEARRRRSPAGARRPDVPGDHRRGDGQTLIHGMGELHLEIIVDRLLREFKVEANVGKPQVAYRETIRKKAEAAGNFVRQTGGRGQYGDVYLEVEPNEPGKGFEFENKIVGGAIPREYIPAVEKGIREALDTGVLAGYPIVDIKVG